jgi:hypothetical protein
LGGHIVSADEEQSLITHVAQSHGVPAQLLSDLLGLEAQFPDMTVFGSKTHLLRTIGTILDQALADTKAQAE